MEPIEFCRWLQGWFELNKTIDHREGATPETMKVIEEHLQLVFDKRTKTTLTQSHPFDISKLSDGTQPLTFIC